MFHNIMERGMLFAATHINRHIDVQRWNELQHAEQGTHPLIFKGYGECYSSLFMWSEQG